MTGKTQKQGKWLNIIGIGEDGVDGLSRDAIACLENTEIIIGGDRHHQLTPTIKAERISWPSPFDAMIDLIKSFKGRRIAILVTGDPLWYSVGSRISRVIAVDEIRFFPQISAFQWAAVRLGWSLADCDTLTVHGRPVEQIIPYIAPNARLLILTQDKTSPAAIAKLLTERGFGKSAVHVLASLGGKNEKRFDGVANRWRHQVPDFNILAVQCIAGKGAQFYSRIGGLPDDAFEHDGQITKRVVRAATLSALQPYPEALLWDVGAGCGSVGIEWMRSAREAQAIAIETDTKRLSIIANNARTLGTPKLITVKGKTPKAFTGLPTPDAVFIGGGVLQDGVFEGAWKALRPGGRLVANAVTLESEARLVELYKNHGGTLERISVSQVSPVGRYYALKPLMPVIQWALSKPYGTSS